MTPTATTSTQNSHLATAKAAKNDEFYTQWADIEREMNAYLEYDPDVFRDKIILLPCDDPEWSNFTKPDSTDGRARARRSVLTNVRSRDAGRLDRVVAVVEPFVSAQRPAAGVLA